MPPQQPKADLISQAIIGQLREGFETRDDLWYRPDAIERYHAFTRKLTDGGHECFVILSPDDQEDEEMTYEDTQGTRRYDLTAARKIQCSTEDPWTRTADDEIREEVQNKLAHDIKKLLRGEKRLVTEALPGGLVLTTKIPLTQQSAEDTYLPDWAVVYMRVEVEFEFPDDEPGAEVVTEMLAETLPQACAMLQGLAEDVARLRARVEALEQPTPPVLAPDPNEPHPGFLRAKAKARAHDERRKA